MPPVRFHYDYVDPASWIVDRRLRSILGDGLPGIELRPREVRLPRQEPLDPSAAVWVDYWEAVTGDVLEARDRIRIPQRLPHTRKAHELVLHAGEVGGASPVRLHSAIFRAALEEGRDIGRVDVLVELAVAAGLDRTETRAALDVDRYAGEIERIRSAASDTGVVGVPTLVRDGELLEGVRDVDTIRAFVGDTAQSD